MPVVFIFDPAEEIMGRYISFNFILCLFGKKAKVMSVRLITEATPCLD